MQYDAEGWTPKISVSLLTVLSFTMRGILNWAWAKREPEVIRIDVNR
jgi:hypothetical protein